MKDRRPPAPASRTQSETAWIAIGADRNEACLIAQPGENMGKQALPAQLHQRLVAAAHAQGPAAGQHHRGRDGSFAVYRRNRRKPGANDGARTRDIQDHNLALYQLSYVRHRMKIILVPGGGV